MSRSLQILLIVSTTQSVELTADVLVTFQNCISLQDFPSEGGT